MDSGGRGSREVGKIRNLQTVNGISDSTAWNGASAFLHTEGESCTPGVAIPGVCESRPLTAFHGPLAPIFEDEGEPRESC